MISTRSVGLLIDTVVCLTLAKWETVSGRFGGYFTDHKLTPGAIRHYLSKREICAYASCGSTPTGMENRGQGRASMVMTPVAGLHQCLCAVSRADRLAGSCMKLFFWSS